MYQIEEYRLVINAGYSRSMHWQCQCHPTHLQGDLWGKIISVGGHAHEWHHPVRCHTGGQYSVSEYKSQRI